MNRGGNRRKVIYLIVACALLPVIGVHLATAGITTTGSIDPLYDGTDPWVPTSELIVGHSADASILVSGGSQVQVSDRTIIGSSPGVTGGVTVTGTGSVWDSWNPTDVGKYGNGTMTVENGADFVSRETVMGRETGSVGHVLITGPGTTWEGGATLPGFPSIVGGYGLAIGYNGVGEVIVSNGAKVTAGWSVVWLGVGPQGTGSLAVTGSNSTWEPGCEMGVGLNGTGSLLISGGATLANTRTLDIAIYNGAHGSATVTGPGSTLQVGEALLVGVYGQGELLVSDGGRVESVGGRIGTTVAGQYSVATVTGPGSAWLNSDVLNIGYLGRGRMVIEDGGHMTCERADVGWDPSETGIVEVRGAGSAFDMNWRLLLGGAGTGTMYVEDGGRVTSATAQLGGASTGVGLAVVDGAGSAWSNTGSMSLWGASTLRILDGGLVESGDVTAWGGTAIEGDGTLRTSMLTTWGTIRPGSSIGTLTVHGNVTMEPNSVLETQIDNAGHSDKLHVAGDVNIVGGIVRAVPVEAITQSHQYTIVEANNVSGKFNALDISPLGPAATSRLAVLTYGTDSVQLTITPFDEVAGLTRNQRSLGTALQKIAGAGPTPVTVLLQQLPTLDAVRASYNQLSGQSRPPLAPIAVTDSARFMGIVANRLQGARGMVAEGLESLSDSPLLAMASPDDRGDTPVRSDAGFDGSVLDQEAGRPVDHEWGVWAKMYALLGDRQTEHGTPGYSYDVFGQSFGLDIRFTERFIGGLTGGRSDSHVDYDRLADEADIDTVHVGLYGSYSGDGWYVNYVGTHSWLNFDTRRVVDLTAEQHKGDFDGDEWSGCVEAGFDWEPAATWLVQPLAAFQVSHLHLDQYAETVSASTLVFEGQDFESYKGSLGARVTKELILDSHGRSAIVQGRARWVHEFGDSTSSVDARFEDVPSVFFTVRDEAVARDSFLLGTGLGLRLTRGLRAFVDYDASLNPDITAQIVSGALEYRW